MFIIDGDELLELDIRIICLLLVWDINFMDWIYFMMMIVQFNIEDFLFIDNFDFIGVFVGSEL